MTCSCPDWAVPCKHLAAVIYLLSREIDGNPFLVFSLRGIELTQALKGRGIQIEHEARAALPTIGTLMRAEDHATVTLREETNFDRIDFSVLSDLAATLPQILAARPPCFPSGDLREMLRGVIVRVAKAAKKALDASLDTEPTALCAEDRPMITFDARGEVAVSGTHRIQSLPHLMQALAAVELTRLADFQPETAALCHVRQAALHLLTQGAVVPQVFAAPAGQVGVRWLPAMLDATVRQVVAALALALPSGLARFGESDMLSPQRQAEAILAVFLGHYLRVWSDTTDGSRVGDKMLTLLFKGGPVRFDGPGEGAVAAGLQNWLARLHLARREYTPILCIEEDDANITLNVAIEQTATESEQPVPLREVLVEPAWSAARFGVLQTVALLTEFCPLLEGYVRTGARQAVRIASDELPGLLFDTLPVVRLLGIRVLLPRALEHVWRPKLSVSVSTAKQRSSGLLDVDALFAFDWRVAIGDEMLGPDAFERLVRKAHGLVRFRGQYVYLDPHEIERLQRHLSKPPTLSGAELLRTALAGEFEGAPVVLNAHVRSLIRELTTVDELAPPKGLNAVLRPYQQRGYAWMYRNLRIGLGSVIADDMGLGKTLQVIAALDKLREEGTLEEAKALVVVPTSLLTNWQKEIARFAPALRVGVFHGAKRELAQDDRPDVLLTTYGIARSAQAALKALAWRVIVVDEAQNIKNPAAAQTRAIKSLPASAFIAMSGTPVENGLAEYWSIMDFANRGYLGTLTHFERTYAQPIQTDRDQAVVQRFRQITAPFLMRRLKSDRSIIDDLPEKIELDQYCALTESQTALYESVVREGLRAIQGESEAFKRQGLVLQMILALKQICNHPAQYLKHGKGEASASGKVGRLFELVDEIHASHEKVLVFTQFREMGELLRGWLGERYGRAPQFLHGGVARKRRDDMVEHFQHDRTERVFLLSLKAGGTGLNLTAASNVIHFDLWWNPAVEAQATDRAYRIGQRSNVQVHRLITEATFEERINDMIKGKRELAELAVGTGEQWIGNLSDHELHSLFSLNRASSDQPL
nr:SNF2-related protein [Burkholderia sp. Ac-20353]